jgi:hypothetical protein
LICNNTDKEIDNIIDTLNDISYDLISIETSSIDEWDNKVETIHIAKINSDEAVIYYCTDEYVDTVYSRYGFFSPSDYNNLCPECKEKFHINEELFDDKLWERMYDVIKKYNSDEVTL